MESENSMYFFLRLPVNGWHRGKQKQEQILIIIFWLEQISPLIQEVPILVDIAECAAGSFFFLKRIRGKKQGLLPFSCSAASLRSANFDPTMLWLRISLCSCIHKHPRKNKAFTHHLTEEASDYKISNDSPLCLTSLNLDSFCTLPCWPGRSLYPEDLKAASLGLSEKVSSAVGGKLGAPFLELRVPTVSQETALIRGGKAPMVLISAVQGACWVGGRGTGLATPVAGVWLGFRPGPGPSSVLPTAGGLLGTAGSQFSFWTAKRGVRVPEETFLFSEGFQSTNSLLPWGEQGHSFY